MKSIKRNASINECHGPFITPFPELHTENRHTISSMYILGAGAGNGKKSLQQKVVPKDRKYF